MPSTQTGHDPHALLTQAIEKLLYLESRLEASEAANDGLARDRDRHREAAREARRTLTEWQRRAVQAEVSAESAERESAVLRATLGETRAQLRPLPDERELAARLQDAEAQLARLQAERETWLDRMVAVGQLRGDQDALDLGGFISELRAELLALRRGEKREAPATVARPPRRPDPQALLRTVQVPAIELDLLVRELRLPRAEKTLAALCARELVEGTAAQRRRSADRLREAGIAAFNPWVVQRLETESDPGVREAFVRLLDTTGGAGISVALERAMSDTDARVRAAALDGLTRRDGDRAIRALQDPSPALRRRALARLPRTGSALDALADALRDDDDGVRRVAVTVLAGRTGREAIALLQAAVTLPDVEVAEVARAALLARGEPLEAPRPHPADADAPPPAAEALEDTDPPDTGPEPLADEPPEAAAEPVEARPELATPEDPAIPETPPEAAAGAWEADPDLVAVLDEVRRSIRGRTVEELVEFAGVDAETAVRAADALVAEGLLVWRGRKLWPA